VSEVTVADNSFTQIPKTPILRKQVWCPLTKTSPAARLCVTGEAMFGSITWSTVFETGVQHMRDGSRFAKLRQGRLCVAAAYGRQGRRSVPVVMWSTAAGSVVGPWP